jgi:hypothetical protein
VISNPRDKGMDLGHILLFGQLKRAIRYMALKKLFFDVSSGQQEVSFTFAHTAPNVSRIRLPMSPG